MTTSGESRESGVLAHVERLERDAIEALTEATSGTSLCAIGRSGASFPAAKFHEGAAAALAELRRALRTARSATGLAGSTDPLEPGSGQPDGGEQSLAMLLTAQERWRERANRMTGAGDDWRAYLAGGRDALERVALVIGTSSDG